MISRRGPSVLTPETDKIDADSTKSAFYPANCRVNGPDNIESAHKSIPRSLLWGLTLISLTSPASAATTAEFKKISISTSLSARLIMNEDEINEDSNSILAALEQRVVAEEKQQSTEIIQPDTKETPDGSETATQESIAAKAEPVESVEPDQKIKLAVIENNIKQAVQSWVMAWSDQDLSRYLDHYSKDFVPANKELTRAQWVDQRTERVSKPSQIKLSITEIQFTGMHNQVMQVIFRQKYDSDTYGDEIIKSLDFHNQDSVWKIVGEKTVKVLKYRGA